MELVAWCLLALAGQENPSTGREDRSGQCVKGNQHTHSCLAGPGIVISQPEDKVTLYFIPARVKRGYPQSLTYVQEVKPWQQNWTKWVPQSCDPNSTAHSSLSVSRPGFLVLKCNFIEGRLSRRSPVPGRDRVLGGGGDRKAVSKDPQGFELLPSANQVSNTIKKANK